MRQIGISTGRSVIAKLIRTLTTSLVAPIATINLTLETTPKACTWNGYVRQSYSWQETMNKTITNTFDISGSFKTGTIEHQLLVGADVSREDRSPKLGNYSSGTGVPRYYGFINPYNPAD